MFALRRNFLVIRVGARFDLSGLPGDICESKKISVVWLDATEGLPIQKQFHFLAVRHDINGLLRAGGICPMSDDMDLRIIAEHPQASVVGIFAQARAIYF